MTFPLLDFSFSFQAKKAVLVYLEKGAKAHPAPDRNSARPLLATLASPSGSSPSLAHPRCFKNLSCFLSLCLASLPARTCLCMILATQQSFCNLTPCPLSGSRVFGSQPSFPCVLYLPLYSSPRFHHRCIGASTAWRLWAPAEETGTATREPCHTALVCPRCCLCHGLANPPRRLSARSRLSIKNPGSFVSFVSIFVFTIVYAAGCAQSVGHGVQCNRLGAAVG
jgi:hypothetical protein